MNNNYHNTHKERPQEKKVQQRTSVWYWCTSMRKYCGGDGFAMLFTVLIISIILAIAIGISSSSFKQSILSGLVRDSQIAFYQADSATECALRYELQVASSKGRAAPDVPCATLAADGKSITNKTYAQTNASAGTSGYFIYEDSTLSGGTGDKTKPCFTMIFDKTDPNGAGLIQGYGYNTCDDKNPRRIERAIEVVY